MRVLLEGIGRTTKIVKITIGSRDKYLVIFYNAANKSEEDNNGNKG
jgi:hypothetical protein